MDLKELQGWDGDLETHWYYASKAAALCKIVKRLRFSSIADIGAGSGFFAKHLLGSRSDATKAICVDINYPRNSEESIGQKTVSYRKEGTPVLADLYLLMDVLEHVEQEEEFLRSLVSNAPIGAYFVVTVPAFNFLWSSHDIFLGHHRRYTLNEITDVAQRAGLSVEKSCYFFSSIFPAVAAVRLSRRLFSGSKSGASSDMRQFPGVLNDTLRAICRLEERVFTMNQAFGLTAFVLATRRS